METWPQKNKRRWWTKHLCVLQTPHFNCTKKEMLTSTLATATIDPVSLGVMVKKYLIFSSTERDGPTSVCLFSAAVLIGFLWKFRLTLRGVLSQLWPDTQFQLASLCGWLNRFVASVFSGRLFIMSRLAFDWFLFWKCCRVTRDLPQRALPLCTKTILWTSWSKTMSDELLLYSDQIQCPLDSNLVP